MSSENDKTTLPFKEGSVVYWLQVLLGIAFALAGLILFVEAQQFRPMRPGTQIGPGLLPSICGVAFMILGPSLVISTVLDRKPAKITGKLDAGSPLFILLIILGMLGVINLMPYMGFIITCAAYSWLVTWFAGAKWWGAAISSIAISIFVYYLFTEHLRVILPPGTLF